jgi:allantoinase
MYDLVIRSARVFTGQAFEPAAVAIAGGVIRAIEPVDAPLEARLDRTLPAGQVLQPGVVDTHVHVNEPGRTDWEGFASATLAAAAGGVTTIIDMPLNSIPPTTTVAALELKRLAAGLQATVNVGFWGGAIPANLGALKPLHDAGVFGFKAFLSPSGSTSSRTSPPPSSRPPPPRSPASTACSWCTPRTPPCSRATRTPAAPATSTSSPADRMRPKTPRSPG